MRKGDNVTVAEKQLRGRGEKSKEKTGNTMRERGDHLKEKNPMRNNMRVNNIFLNTPTQSQENQVPVAVDEPEGKRTSE